MTLGLPTTTVQGCGLPKYANDKYCDDQNNNAGCNWDGGACCNNNFISWNLFCSGNRILFKT